MSAGSLTCGEAAGKKPRSTGFSRLRKTFHPLLGEGRGEGEPSLFSKWLRLKVEIFSKNEPILNGPLPRIQPLAIRACFENRSRKGLRARRGGWRGATRAHIREKSATEEQRSQTPRPAARPTGIFSKHALSLQPSFYSGLFRLNCA